MRHFIPARDELIFDSPVAAGVLVPYRVGRPCLHWEAAIATPEDEQCVLAYFRADSPADPPAPGPATEPRRR